ncbi:MAG TPA: hypothetical protein VG204_22870 [Terriglobia bacterium]|nr:hypothetical protein [Terriglobia bacterium]
MGVWGVGLYSGDFAMDLRGTIKAVARLPFDADQLVDILCQTEPTAANHPDDEDHTAFWLVVAHQFAKRGIACERVRDKALEIIDAGRDLAMLAKLGMDPSGLEARGKMLAVLRVVIAAPPSSKPRTVLKKPQAFVMNVGDVFVYPTRGGKCINAYAPSKARDLCWAKDGVVLKEDGWSVFLIVDRGRAFDFLAWYRPLKVSTATVEKPTLAALNAGVSWKLAWPGTCSPVHFKRLELERIGTLPVDSDKLRSLFGKLWPGTRQAISDISICNELNVGAPIPRFATRQPREAVNYMRRGVSTILSIEQILAR